MKKILLKSLVILSVSFSSINCSVAMENNFAWSARDLNWIIQEIEAKKSNKIEKKEIKLMDVLHLKKLNIDLTSNPHIATKEELDEFFTVFFEHLKEIYFRQLLYANEDGESVERIKKPLSRLKKQDVDEDKFNTLKDYVVSISRVVKQPVETVCRHLVSLMYVELWNNGILSGLGFFNSRGEGTYYQFGNHVVGVIPYKDNGKLLNYISDPMKIFDVLDQVLEYSQFKTPSDFYKYCFSSDEGKWELLKVAENKRRKNNVFTNWPSINGNLINFLKMPMDGYVRKQNAENMRIAIYPSDTLNWKGSLDNAENSFTKYNIDKYKKEIKND